MSVSETQDSSPTSVSVRHPPGPSSPTRGITQPTPHRVDRNRKGPVHPSPDPSRPVPPYSTSDPSHVPHVAPDPTAAYPRTPRVSLRGIHFSWSHSSRDQVSVGRDLRGPVVGWTGGRTTPVWTTRRNRPRVGQKGVLSRNRPDEGGRRAGLGSHLEVRCKGTSLADQGTPPEIKPGAVDTSPRVRQ